MADNVITMSKQQLLDLMAGRELLNDLENMGFSDPKDQKKILDQMSKKGIGNPEEAAESLGMEIEGAEDIEKDEDWVQKRLAEEFETNKVGKRGVTEAASPVVLDETDKVYPSHAVGKEQLEARAGGKKGFSQAPKAEVPLESNFQPSRSNKVQDLPTWLKEQQELKEQANE